jgi:predicted Fe-Mo cluster-binding NifX family protein
VRAKVAIPRTGERVAPCFEYSATIAIFTLEGDRVVDQLDFPFRSQDPLDRVRLLRDQDVDTIICGGMQDIFEDLVRASGIHLISWVSGSVDDLLHEYVGGGLAPGNPPGHRISDNRSRGKRREN